MGNVLNLDGSTEHIYDALRSYRLPNGSLPLARQRTPFAELGEAAIRAAVQLALAFPEKCGRLSEAVHGMFGLGRPALGEHIVIEGHIDCTQLSQVAANSLIALGFEPDSFVKFVPAAFDDHFTLKFVVSRSRRERYRELRREVFRRCEAAAAILGVQVATRGYVELEIYTSNCRLALPYKVPERSDLARFPFPDGSLRVAPMPREASGDFARCKTADIHVKTPTSCRGSAFHGADGEIMEELRERFVAMGLYEVMTEAGNRVYTAQFLDAFAARRVYRRLGEYLGVVGGIVDMVYEPCVRVWRTGDGTHLAEMPPVVTQLMD
ncbi:MAG: hypothetical protein U0359_00230 [Byssovorax sp.]